MPAASSRRRIAEALALGVLLHALFFTQSYAGLLALFGAVFTALAAFAVRKSVSTRKAVTALFLLGVIFGAAVLSQLHRPKFQQFLDFTNRSSSTVRLEVYTISTALVRQFPVLGVGPGLFQARYQNASLSVLGRPPLEWNIPHPHNVFLAFWLNAGLLGLGAFLLLLVLAHRRFTFSLIALWGIVFHGFFDTPFWKNDLSLIFWLIVAAIFILQTHATSAHAEPSHPRGRFHAFRS